MQKSFRTRAARRSAPKLARISASVFAGLAKKTKFVDPSLTEHWLTVAGPEIASLCRPGRIIGAGAARTLEIYVSSGASATEFQYFVDDLKTRLNAYLGPGAISHIAIKQHARRAVPAGGAPKEPSPLDAALASFRQSIGKKPHSS